MIHRIQAQSFRNDCGPNLSLICVRRMDRYGPTDVMSSLGLNTPVNRARCNQEKEKMDHVRFGPTVGIACDPATWAVLSSVRVFFSFYKSCKFSSGARRWQTNIYLLISWMKAFLSAMTYESVPRFANWYLTYIDKMKEEYPILTTLMQSYVTFVDINIVKSKDWFYIIFSSKIALFLHSLWSNKKS